MKDVIKKALKTAIKAIDLNDNLGNDLDARIAIECEAVNMCYEALRKLKRKHLVENLYSPDWIKKTNWEKLSSQKYLLLSLIDNQNKEIDKDLLEGIINWMDTIQDWATDNLEIKKEVISK